MTLGTHTDGSRVLVLGLGISGMAAATLLLREGHTVTVLDASHGPEQQERAAALRISGARVILDAERIPDGVFDFCVVSPGLSFESPWSREVRARGLPVVTELDLGAARCRCPIVAVTGTNGKSTLVKLCADLLCAAGLRAEPAGNYGVPLCDVAGRSASLDWVVVEVSSFQMEWPGAFRPRVGVLLNVQPDHLDRHGSLAHYRALKARLFANMGKGDSCVVPATLADMADTAARRGARLLAFGEDDAVAYCYRPGTVSRRGDNEVVATDIAGTYFDNPILGLAAAAACGVADACGVENATIERTIRAFTPLPHRMQRVASYDGVTYIDDSKATNLAAMVAALRMTPPPVFLIAGGLLKEKDLDCVKEVLAKRVARIYLVGNSTIDMESAWGGIVDCRMSGTLERAVAQAAESAKPRTTVLLSPGCASFDQFRNYGERGDCFQKLVRLRYRGGVE